MVTLQLVATSLASLGVSGLFGASLYDAVVLAPNFKGGPATLEHGRLFMVNATPANLFRVLSPTTQVLLLVAVVANWSGPERRWPLIGALVALVLCDVITFTYHYPRLRIMVEAPAQRSGRAGDSRGEAVGRGELHTSWARAWRLVCNPVRSHAARSSDGSRVARLTCACSGLVRRLRLLTRR